MTITGAVDLHVEILLLLVKYGEEEGVFFNKEKKEKCATWRRTFECRDSDTEN